jgi:hypothetical protein
MGTDQAATQTRSLGGLSALSAQSLDHRSPGEPRRERNRSGDRLSDTQVTIGFCAQKELAMNITLSLAPLISLVAGILILIVPRLLNYIVAAYLIVVGVLGLFGDIRLK